MSKSLMNRITLHILYVSCTRGETIWVNTVFHFVFEFTYIAIYCNMYFNLILLSSFISYM